MDPIRTVRITDLPQDILAAVPHLLGFHPQDSLVLIVMQEGQVVVTIRTDLPEVHHRHALAYQLVPAVHAHSPADVMIVVFGGGPATASAKRLPHAGTVEVLKESLKSVGVRVALTAWAQSTDLGARWCSYENPDMNGTLPDPKTTELSAATAAAGLVTFANRKELAAHVAPVDDEILARRRVLLDDGPEWSFPDRDAPAAFRLIHDTIAASSGRSDPLGDEKVVQLVRALSDYQVRDACLAFAVGENVEVAENLWLELTRGCPSPERAEPASLLAFSAYLRGDGALASVALEQASSAHPDHNLSNLLRTALDAAIPPSKITGLARRMASQEASFLLAESAEGSTD